MTHSIMTFITKVDPNKRGSLELLLGQIRQHPAGNSYIPFASLPRLHFASFTIFDDDEYGPYLVFENNFDGTLNIYLNELLQVAGVGLHEIYGCCLEYPANSYDPAKLASYLKARVVRPNAYHIGNVGRSAERIRQESLLRERIQSHLDDFVSQGKGKEAPDLLRKHIQQFVTADRSLEWAGAPINPRQTLWERVMPWVKIILFGLCTLILLPLLIPLAIIWVIVLRRKEKCDLVRSEPVPASHLRRLTEREDWFVQNHLASITTVKPGWFRRVTLRLVLWIANLLARTSNKGELSGIPSIHFAHWSLIDRGRRLLFLSNYDGSWGSYLDDFIDKASTGLTGIWSNTAGFPPTRFLVFGGAKNESGFKAIARHSQTPASVWYSAYPDLTVQNIDNGSLIREDLFTELNDNAVKNWLQLF